MTSDEDTCGAPEREKVVRANPTQREQRRAWRRTMQTPVFSNEAPDEDALTLLETIRQSGLTTGLDIGCGRGRHLLAAAKLGLDVTGIDTCRVSIGASRSLLKREGFRADVRVAEMTSLPHISASVDFTFAWCALNHGTEILFWQAIRESVRVVRAGGIVAGMVLTRCDFRYGKGVPVEAHSFIFDTGPERGVLHHFPDAFSLERFFFLLGDPIEMKIVETEPADMKSYYPEPGTGRHLYYAIRIRDRGDLTYLEERSWQKS